jgi:membrane associated rhomboid family serine protease
MSLRQLRDAVVLMGAFLALIWVLQVANWADSYRLDTEFGILPEHVSRLGDIFTAPFLHFSWQHIEGNSVPLFVLGVLAAYRSIKRFLLMSLIVAVTSGLAVWFFQPSNELTVGASGLIFGYFGYVLIRGFFDRNFLDIGVGLVAGVLYWTILQVAIPGTPGVSWIGHLGGLVGGVFAAWLLRARTVPAVAGATGTPGATGVTRGWTSGLPSRGPRPRAGGTSRAPGGPGAPGAGGATRAPGRPSASSHPASKSVDDLLRELEDKGF